MKDLVGKLTGMRTYIAAAVLFALGVYLVWTTGDVAQGVLPIAMALGFFGVRAKQQRDAEMLARNLLIAKKMAAKIPLTPEERAQLLADGMVLVGGVLEPAPRITTPQPGYVPPNPETYGK